MRNSLICFFMFFFPWIALHAQSDCSMFYPFKEGVKLEYTYYDKKGKLESKSQSVIKTIKALPNSIKTIITNTIFDKKDKEQFAGEYLIRCEGGVVKMDASTMLNPAMQQSFANMEVSIEGEDLTIPKKLTEGQELPDASTNIKAGTGGINIVNMTVNITDRRVLGKESVTTPAGTFDCYKVTQTTDVKMMLGKEFSSIEYYAEGIGVVRSETYDKKGNLDGYMELTSIEK